MAGTSTKAKQQHPQRQQEKRKTFQWADFQKEADRRTEGRDKRPSVEPFIIDDVEPPIVINPPDEKTALVIAEQIGLVTGDMLDPSMSIQRVLPLLRAFCGDQFPRVWAMLPKENTTESVYIVLQALQDHFTAQMQILAHAREVAELPGGSAASSD